MNSDPDIDHQLEDADSTALLVGMYSELQKIRWNLEKLNDTLAPSEQEQPQYECVYCHTVVGEDKRDAHARDVHNAPESIPLDNLFTAV